MYETMTTIVKHSDVLLLLDETGKQMILISAVTQTQAM